MRKIIFPLIRLIIFLGSAPFAFADNHFASLHTFSHSEGQYPNTLTVAGSTIYGTTSSGGPEGNGIVFALNPDSGSFQSLHSFGDGSQATYFGSSLTTEGSTLYGITHSGGRYRSGTVFAMNPDGSSFQNLHEFNGFHGRTPTTLIAVGSTLYGGTWSGPIGYGTIFAINFDGSGFNMLRSFYGYDGFFASALTSVGSTLYGTTGSGGLNSDGTVFAMNFDGSGFQTLHSFNALDGHSPNTLIAVGSTLYGTTSIGGGYGTVFTMNLDGSGLQTLHSFNGLDGSIPSTLIAIGSTLYGTTINGGLKNHGTVFAMNLDGSGFQSLHSFNGSDGTAPSTLTAIGSTLYGTTSTGGENDAGTIFSVSVPETNSVMLSGSSFAMLFALVIAQRLRTRLNA